VTVNGLRGKEATIAPVLWPHASVKLPASGGGADRITVIYRAMFIARPMVKELTREGTA
jgi:hypothetical protein